MTDRNQEKLEKTTDVSEAGVSAATAEKDFPEKLFAIVSSVSKATRDTANQITQFIAIKDRDATTNPVGFFRPNSGASKEQLIEMKAACEAAAEEVGKLEQQLSNNQQHSLGLGTTVTSEHG